MQYMATDWTPEKLVNEMKKTIIGQDRYLESLCTAVWLHNLHKELHEETEEEYACPKQNLLILGKSGSGKTLAVQTLAGLLDLNLVIEDASQFTGAGWKGREVSAIARDVVSVARDTDDAEYSIVFLDEIDKVFLHSKTDPTFAPTHNLLKTLEGTVLQYAEGGNTWTLDTKNILFIAAGAFDGLEEIIVKRMRNGNKIGFQTQRGMEPSGNLFQHADRQDLIEYGINPQFLGRISVITAINELGADDFKQILLKSEKSAVAQYDTLLYESLGVHASITESAAELIAKKAVQEKTGARTLMSVVSGAYGKGIYKLAGRKDVRELKLDCNGQGALALRLEKGTPDTPKSGLVGFFNSRVSCEEWKSVPLKLNQYTDAGAFLFAEEVAEISELPGRKLSAKYSYREIRAAVCMITGGILAVVSSDMDQTLWEVEQSMEAYALCAGADFFKERAQEARGGAMEFYKKSERYEPKVHKTLKLAQSMLEELCFLWMGPEEPFGQEY